MLLTNFWCPVESTHKVWCNVIFRHMGGRTKITQLQHGLRIIHLKGNIQTTLINSSPTISCLLITFANRLEPDQAQQNVGPDLDPIYFETEMVFMKEFFKKVDFEKKSAEDKSFPWGQSVNLIFVRFDSLRPIISLSVI